MKPVLIEETPKELKITADYESVTITKSNFFEFNFTKFDELVWTKEISDLKEMVLFQIHFTKKNAIPGTFVLTMEETHRVGNWLWNIIGANETKEFREATEERFGKKSKKMRDENEFNFPTHFHRFMKSSFKVPKKMQEKMDAEKREAEAMGEGYRKTLSGDWSILVPVSEEVSAEMLERFDKTKLPVEQVNVIVLQVEHPKSTAIAA